MHLATEDPKIGIDSSYSAARGAALDAANALALACSSDAPPEDIASLSQRMQHAAAELYMMANAIMGRR